MLSILFVARGACNFVLLEMLNICVAQCVHHVYVFSVCSCVLYVFMCSPSVLLNVLYVAQCINVAHP